jgi:saccharopine dehydrogenase-like NADP-dependent oxidoreductase
MKAAVNSGAHYVDTALDYPFITQLAERKPLEIDSEFKKAGLTALIACGGTPGVTNVLARYACDKLDRVDEIYVKGGDSLLEDPHEVVDAWDPGWSPEIALLDYATETMMFENGKYKECAPFSGCEEYDFPDPVGPVVVCYHAHEEGTTLPRFIGKGLKHVDVKYPIDPIAGALVKMGFAKSEPIDVRGVKVSPLDVLMNLVRHPVDTFLTEDEDTVKVPPKFVDLLVVDIKGAKSGEEVTYKLSWPHNLFTNPEERLEVYRKSGTAEIAVALPAIAGAKMCVAGNAGRGVIAPKCLDPIKFLKMMAAMGAPVKFHEVCSREICVS